MKLSSLEPLSVHTYIKQDGNSLCLASLMSLTELLLWKVSFKLAEAKNLHSMQ